MGCAIKRGRNDGNHELASGLNRVHPFFTKLHDREFISFATARQSRPGIFPGRCEEAHQLLQSDDFFSPPVGAPRDMQWTSQHDFQFSSLADSPWTETKTVHGKFYRCGDNWTAKPTVLLIHGWN